MLPDVPIDPPATPAETEPLTFTPDWELTGE
jgi:hypothetical protein